MALRSLYPNASPLEKAAVVVVSWLVPGAGYAWKRDWALFLVNFLLIEGTMLAGLFLFHAGVLVPEMNQSSPEFSWINVLMFVGQLLNGAVALVSAAGMASNVNFLGARPEIWQSDLGTFYILIAGALNVFVIYGIWDRYYSTQELDETTYSEAPSEAEGQVAKENPR